MRSIRRYITALTVIATMAVVIAATQHDAHGGAQKKHSEIESTLIANEKKINEAVKTGDVATFKSLVAEDGWSADMSGWMSVAEFIKAFNEAKISEYSIDDIKVIWLGDDAAIVTYKWSGKGTFMGQPIPPRVIVSTAWANRGGKWVAVFHHETALAETAK